MIFSLLVMPFTFLFFFFVLKKRFAPSRRKEGRKPKGVSNLEAIINDNSQAKKMS
jgi:hypothetical protein